MQLPLLLLPLLLPPHRWLSCTARRQIAKTKAPQI
jgi:hypothetical protein